MVNDNRLVQTVVITILNKKMWMYPVFYNYIH